MRVMRVDLAYLASPKGTSISFSDFCAKRENINITSMTDKKATRTRITHTTRTVYKDNFLYTWENAKEIKSLSLPLA